MISFLIIIIYLLMTTGTMVVLSGKSFGICFVPSVIMSTLSMYFSQMIFKDFLPGMVLNGIFAAIFPFLLFFNFKDNRKHIKDKYLTYGLILFLVIACYLLVADNGYTFNAWDELSHWGMMVKEMYRTGRFYTEDISHLYAHKEYPPFAPLWELFLCKLTCGYSEAVCAFGLHFLNFSMLFSVAAEHMHKKKNHVHPDKVTLYRCFAILLSLFVVLFWVVAMDRDRMLMRIYTDLLIAIILVYCFSLIIFDEAYSGTLGVLFLGAGLVALVLTKQIGIVLSLVIIFYYFVRLVFVKRLPVNTRTVLLSVLSLVVVPVLFWLSWKRYSSGIVTGGQFDFGRISFEEVMNALRGGGSEQSRIIRDAYLGKLFKKSIITGNIKLPFLWLLPVLWIGLGVITFVSNEKDKAKEAVILGITYACGAVGYAFTLFVLYLFCFPNEEPAVCYPRYISSLVIPFVVSLFIFGIKMLDNRISDKGYLITMIFVTVVSCVILKFECFLELKPAFLKEDRYAKYRDVAECIIDNTEPESKIFIVANSNADYQYFVGYYANENIMDFEAAHNLLELDYSDMDVKNNLTAAMANDDYVYVKETSDSFNEAFSYLVDEGSFYSGGLYKVEHSDGDSFKLLMVNADEFE